MGSIKKIGMVSSLFLCFWFQAYSQKCDKSEMLSIRAFVGSPHSQNGREDNYTAFAVVRNNQDTAVTFWIFSQSWDYDNWITDSDSIFVIPLGNDMQTTIKIILQPHQEIEFNFEVSVIQKYLINKSFRLGFIVSEENDWLPSERKKDKRINNKKYWSNVLELKSFPRNYALIPLPVLIN